jgi:hypothetical protein
LVLEVCARHRCCLPLLNSKGSTLRDIVVKSGGSDDRREMARTIQFPKAESEGNLIKIEGNQEVVEKIVAAIQEIIAELDSKTTQIVEISTDKHRSLIGRGGETKKDLESKFKVSIDIPRQGSGQSAIKIDGLPANVEKAKIHILDLVKDQEGETIQVPRKFHHTIADNGQFFRKMRNDHQVTVDHAGHKLPPKQLSLGKSFLLQTPTLMARFLGSYVGHPTAYPKPKPHSLPRLSKPPKAPMLAILCYPIPVHTGTLLARAAITSTASERPLVARLLSLVIKPRTKRLRSLGVKRVLKRLETWS